MTITVGIAMPLYNPQPDYLAEAISSVRAQTRPVDELVLVDDSDVSNEALVSRLAGDLPLRYERNESRQGLVGNWNAAVAASTTTHVLQLHQDDALEPAALERMTMIHEREPGLAICGVGERPMDAMGAIITTPQRSNHRDHVFVAHDEYRLGYDELAYLMLRHGQIFGPPSSVLFSREHFDRIGGFDEAFAHSIDIDFVLRMAQSGGAILLTERLIRTRRHDAQTTARNVAAGHTFRDRELLFERHVPPSLTADELRRIKGNLVVRGVFDGLRAVRNNRWSVGRDAARHARRFWPGPRPVVARAVELLRHRNDDAR